MSFWKAQDTTIHLPEIKQNLSDEDSLNKTNAQLDAAKLKLDYIVYENVQAGSTLIKEVLEFINNNYLRSGPVKVLYSESLLAHYLKNAMLIYFHSRGKLVGMIVGKRKNVYIHNKIHNITEVNFLCLNPKLRSLHLAPYIIGVHQRENILRFKTAMAYYTISGPIKSPPFGTKKIFYRPIKQYTDIKPLKYISGISDISFAEQLEQKLLKYSTETYSIFDHKTTDEIVSILETPAFHNFAFYKDNALTDFICINSVITANDNGTSYKNGYIYMVILSNNSTKYISSILDSVSSYCLKNDIISLLGASHIFSDMSQLGFTATDNSTSYYIYNMNMHPIENTKNGIIMI